MRILYFLLAALFLYFAELQLNDPDPVIWVLIYLAMVVVCVMSAFRYYLRWLMILMALGYITYCVILAPGVLEWMRSPQPSLLFDDLAKMEHLYIEEAREFLGLIICLVVLASVWLRSSQKTIKS